MLVCHLGSGDLGRLGRGDGDKGPDERSPFADERSNGEPVAGYRELQKRVTLKRKGDGR
jgi:hypothetical protein